MLAQICWKKVPQSLWCFKGRLLNPTNHVIFHACSPPPRQRPTSKPHMTLGHFHCPLKMQWLCWQFCKIVQWWLQLSLMCEPNQMQPICWKSCLAAHQKLNKPPDFDASLGQEKHGGEVSSIWQDLTHGWWLTFSWWVTNCTGLSKNMRLPPFVLVVLLCF